MSTERYKDYSFRYVKDIDAPSKVRVYVESQPSYGNLDTSLDTIHRWPAKNDAPPHICFKENFKPSSLSDAQRLARDWANRTDRYIRTGEAISKQISRE